MHPYQTVKILIDSFVSCTCVYFSSKMAYKYYKTCICCKIIHYSWKRCCICNLKLKFRKRFEKMTKSAQHVDTLVREVKQQKKRQSQLKQHCEMSLSVKNDDNDNNKNNKYLEESFDTTNSVNLNNSDTDTSLSNFEHTTNTTKTTTKMGTNASFNARQMSVVEEEPDNI